MAYDRTLIQIRERSFLDLLDLALMVVRRWPVTLAVAALAGVAPFAALNYAIGRLPIFAGVYVEQIVLPWIEAPLATAPLTVALGGLIFGERQTAGRVFRVLWSRAWALLWHQGVLRLLVMGLYPIIPAKLQFLNEVVLLERGAAGKSVRRSAEICGLQSFDLFLQWLGQLGFGALFVGCFWAGTGALKNALVTSNLTWDEPFWADVAGPRFLLGLWLAIVFFGVLRFLTYIDQRTRHEGWEVELRLKAVGRSLEESRSW